ncbi:MAG: acyl-CoA thioesterase [Christensenellales bacterium]|jgi:acyl-CoA hydrolase
MEHREKTVAESRTEHSRIILRGDTNGTGRLFGGRLVEWIDMVAGVVARRHSGCNVTTASIDELSFIAPAHADDTVVLVGQITYVGRTSMEVRVDTFVERLDGEKKQVNRAYLTMVALDWADRPTEVPRLILATDEERQEWAAGLARAAERKRRRSDVQ